MFKELLSIFRDDNPLGLMAEDFNQMLRVTRQLTERAGGVFFGESSTPEERTEIYKTDVQVNKLERQIRKRVIAHLSVQGTAADLPYSLLLMSLVKDAERIGDYAKNLTEVREMHTDAVPDDELSRELREIRKGVEATFSDTADVFASSDRERAVELIEAGRATLLRADTLIQRISRSNCSASVTTALVLGTRYYKRIGAHLLNIISSVVMPLHKLDYYDEKELG